MAVQRVCRRQLTASWLLALGLTSADSASVPETVVQAVGAALPHFMVKALHVALFTGCIM